MNTTRSPLTGLRRHQTKAVVAVTRAVLAKWREVSERSLRETLQRIDEIESWTKGGDLPAFAQDYVSADGGQPGPDVFGCVQLEQLVCTAIYATQSGAALHGDNGLVSIVADHASDMGLRAEDGDALKEAARQALAELDRAA